MRAVTWARDAIFFRFFLGLAAFEAWGLGAPSHPTTCAFGLDLARLRTWVPIVRFGGEGDPGGGHHDAVRGPCGMALAVGFFWVPSLAKFEWPLANQGQLQAQGSQVVLPPPPSLPIVHRDEAHVCACIPGLGAGRPTQHSCAWPRFTVTRTLWRGGNCDQLCWSPTHHIHVTCGLAFFGTFHLLTIRCIIFHIWRRMVHSRPRLGSQQQAEGVGRFF